MSRGILMIAFFALSLGELTSVADARFDQSYFLPKSHSYDPSIPTPKDFFGFEIGERHLQHHQLHAYFQSLAATKSRRVTLMEYARTHGARPLLLMIITSPKNHKQLERIRESHLQLCDPESSERADPKSLPSVVWMGYGVHGNEPSASNASPLVAYHLIASREESVQKLLDETIVLMDPCLNPDGFERFAHWANNHRGATANPDPQHREHRELSPSGRTNYYWFDLNRDWLPAQHPESQGRLNLYRQWMPNVVLDFHEMGADSTYFFQPGVPTRQHPLTPKKNLELTRAFARFHASALDKIGSLYFTEERFDDFYMGKGSTYPDLHGAVGILFEQASARGQKQDTVNGVLEFRFAIRNQVTTSLSSLDAALANRVELNEHMREFYQDSIALGRNAAVPAYIFSAGRDVSLVNEFIRLLRRHRIRVHELKHDVQIGKKVFAKDNSYAIPANQPEYRFLLAMTESRTEFQDKVFYDITSWALPSAFNLEWAEADNSWNHEVLGEPIDTIQRNTVIPEWSDDDYAYLVEWTGLYAPRALGRLLDANIHVKVAQSPFRIQAHGRGRSFAAGTLMVHLRTQQVDASLVRNTLQNAIESDEVNVYPVSTGLTDIGIDLGSGAFGKIEKRRVLLVVGNGVSDTEAGEVWHLLDRRLGIPVSLVDVPMLATTDLDKYSTVIMVSGTYTQVATNVPDRLSSWVRRGGTLVALGTSARWLKSQKICNLELRESGLKDRSEPHRIPYSAAEDNAALQKIEGTIFKTQLDLTHPLTFGISRPTLPVFRDHTMFLEPSSNPYSTPAIYDSEPLLSGYASVENVRLASGSAAVLVKGEGAGRVIAIPNNPVFRGFWFGSERLLVNSVFFGPLVREP